MTRTITIPESVWRRTIERLDRLERIVIDGEPCWSAELERAAEAIRERGDLSLFNRYIERGGVIPENWQPKEGGTASTGRSLRTAETVVSGDGGN